MRVQLQSVILVALGLMAGALAVGALVLYEGFYSVAATRQHFRPTFWLLKAGLHESVEHHARHIAAPGIDEASLRERGLALYHSQCRQCHGAPGISPEAFALGMTPVPTNLVDSTRLYTTAELYWIVKNGLKMTGMPAWEFRLSEGDLWAVVAFVRELPRLSPAQYAERVKSSPAATFPTADAPLETPDPKRGKVALDQYACLTCHRIPEAIGEQAPVGPSLEHIASRHYLAGRLRNTPENMIRWLREPQDVHPGSAMPNLGLSERDARDIAAYLYTLR